MPKAKSEMKAKKREYSGSTEGTLCSWPLASIERAPCGGNPGVSRSPRGCPKL